MIISGKSRGDAVQLGQYLLQQRDNDHVYVHDVFGFASVDVMEAMQEAELIASGTRAKKHLFSLSLNPPHDAEVTAAEFDAAIREVEQALGLTGQPRIAVVHEKGARDRHMHVVFSRIDSREMKAIPVPFNRMKMKDVSKLLFIKHGWDLPEGYIDRSKRDPLRYTLEEYRHAKRVGVHPQEIKAALQDAWAISDSSEALKHALAERGYRLARGDRRGYLAVDHNGEPYSLPKWLGIKTKAVRDRLGNEKNLPSLEEAKATIGRDMLPKMEEYQTQLKQQDETRKAEAKQRRQILVERQRVERAAELKAIQSRQVDEAQARQARFRTGLKGAWDWLRGENRRITAENETDAQQALARDTSQREALIQRQRTQRQWLALRQRQQSERLQHRFRQVREDHNRYEEMGNTTVDQRREEFGRKRRASSEERPRRRKRDPSLER